MICARASGTLLIMLNFIRVEPKESLIVLMFRNLLDYYVSLQATTQTLRFFSMIHSLL